MRIDKGNRSVVTSMKKVLVVDDSSVVQKATKYLFEQMGCLVEIAKDGKSAIKAAEREFDLVLLDLHLPDIDGVMVAKKIKAMKQKIHSKKSLVVAYTSYEKNMKEEQVKQYFDDFIIKPMSEEDANRLIQRLSLENSKENK